MKKGWNSVGDKRISCLDSFDLHGVTMAPGLADLRPLSSNAGRPSGAKGRRCIRHASTGHHRLRG